MLVGVVAKIRNGTLLKYRQDNGLTQKAAALLCGVSLDTWSSIECMRFGGKMSWSRIRKVADFLDVDPSDICPPELRHKTLNLEATAFREAEVSALLAYSETHALTSPSPEQLALDKERDEFTKPAIAKALRSLSPRQREVIEVRWGVGPNNGTHQTLAEVGRQISMTRERVRQIEEKALDKLRLPCHHLEKLLE